MTHVSTRWIVALLAWAVCLGHAPLILASDSDSSGAMEEVIVLGPMPKSILLREVYSTQDQIYQMFNDWNEDDQFDMVCRKEARTGSQIRYKTCRPRFYKDALALATTDTLLDGVYGVPDMSRGTMKRKHTEQRQLMADFANENEEFMALLKRRYLLRKAYEVAIGVSDEGEMKTVDARPYIEAAD